MKKLTLLLIVLLAISATISAKETPVIGEWLLTKIETEGKVEEVYAQITFKEDGYAEWEGRVFGTWERSKKTFTIKSEMIKEFAGERKVEELNSEELILKGPKEKMFFVRFDRDKIKLDNENSNLEGIWKMEAIDGMAHTIIFELPNLFQDIETSDNYKSISKGEWIFNPKDKSILIMTSSQLFGGQNKINNISDKVLVLENNGEIFSLSKVEKSNIKIERLEFAEGDFYDENGDYKYYDAEKKLPWSDSYSIIENLGKVKQLIYSSSTLSEETKTFDTKTLTANIDANVSEQIIILDNIFTGFDRESIDEDYEMQTVKFSSEMRLFPFESYTYRVVGNEEVTTPVGTFNCTVVEAIDSFDERIKLYMINDKPGVLAKVVRDIPGDYGHFIVFSLLEIRN